MLAELAAANAAFSVIKSFVSNGKELTGCAKHISDFVFSKEQLEKKASKQKAKGGSSDLEGRYGLWQDWQAFQAEARKSRRYQEKMAERRQAELMEYMGYGIGFIFVLFFAGLLAWIVGKWMGKF
jgi:hypothetical protein